MEAELRKLRIDRDPTSIMPGSKGSGGPHLCRRHLLPPVWFLGKNSV